MHLLWMTKKIHHFLRYLVFRENISLVQVSILFLLSMRTILGEEPAGSLLCGFAFAFDRYAKSFALSFNANSSSWSSGIYVSLLFKFITNLFDPWEILTQQRHNSDLNSMFTVQIIGCNFQHGLNFRVFLGSSPSVVMLLLLLEECIHDRPLHEIVWEICSVFRPESCQFSTTLWNPASIQDLLNLSCCDSFSIRSSYCCNRKIFTLGHDYPEELLTWSHWARLRNLIAPSQRVSPFFHEGFHTLHISPRLLRKDWAGLQKQWCEK